MNVIINDKSCIASIGEKLSRVAQENQCHVGYVCGGHGVCQTCYVTVLEGEDCLSDLSDIERAFLSEKQIAGGGRLACQTTIEKEGTIRVLSRPEEIRRMLLQNPLSLFSYGAQMGKAAAERFIPGVSNVIDRIRNGEMNNRENLGDLLEGMGFAIKFGASTAADNIPFKDQFNALLELIQRFAPFSLPGTEPASPSLERVSLTVSGSEPQQVTIPVKASKTVAVPSSELEALGFRKADRMNKAGLMTTADLLAKGQSPQGRKMLALELELDEKEVLSIINCADLCRIEGIDMKIAGLLEASGVDTVPELSHRNPHHLHSKIQEVSLKEKILVSLPSLSDLETWIAEAKKLPRVMTY
ncbi:MAG: DUF4332 domain-containing protein [Prosthecochloris sp.]|uniref:DUF4332 domain-containing protein n=1 Tax=Prosthecochloris sp. TaxID=290513 RepID=UPI0013C5BB0F|nr:DUF4332 domain-containing protein [Prosthecochloris sp.]NEX11926.1 DUF4332 domain-containing protein [Prosthecochloris sp.]